MDGNEDACRFAAGVEDDIGDVAGGQCVGSESLAFKHGSDFFGEGVGDSIAMVGSGSVLWHRGSIMGERLRISELGRSS